MSGQTANVTKREDVGAHGVMTGGGSTAGRLGHPVLLSETTLHFLDATGRVR